MRLTAPLTKTEVARLRVGDRVSLSGIVYGARDAAHQRIVEGLEQGQPPPIPLSGQVIYYVGPAPAPPGRVIGPAGPTTAARMDPWTIPLLERGLLGMIGKGTRGPLIREALMNHGAVYFAAVGGAAALLARHITSQEVIAYPELGPEAVRKLELTELPLIVACDVTGDDLFESGRRENASAAGSG